MAGLETIPAIIRPLRLDRATRLIRQLIENLQREDLNDMDRAAGLVALRETLQAAREAGTSATGGQTTRVTWEEVGERVGLTKGRISQLLGLLALPEPIQADVRAGRLTEYDARPYKGLAADQQVELPRARREQTLDTQQVREVARLLKQDASRPVDEAVQQVIASTPRPQPQPKPEPPLKQPAPALAVEQPGEVEADAAVLGTLATLPTPQVVTTLLAAWRMLAARADFDAVAVATELEALARELQARG